MRLALSVALASLLSTQVAPGGVLIYKLSVVEQFAGAGMDRRGAIRGTVILDLNTSNLTFVASRRLRLAHELCRRWLPTASSQSGRCYSGIFMIIGRPESESATS
jgi:hypothetical protein